MTPEHAQGPETLKYDVFISYSTDPDYGLVRKLESFLEGFHRLKTPKEIALRDLNVCIDGSDFSLAKLRARGAGDRDGVSTLIENYLAQSKQLLVLCSRRARASSWVDLEVRWFLEHRGAESILLAVSEGVDPGAEAAEIFSPTIIGSGLNTKPWYDFRAFRGSAAQGWSKVKQFDDERIRLAADLNGHAAGDVQPIWYREQGQSRRRRRMAVTAALTVVLIASVIAGWQMIIARREQGLKLISDTYELLYRDPSAAFLKAYRATTLVPGAESQAALDAAYKVAVLHHYNRREIAQITGSGPSYLAGRWKQGDTFSEASPDGRHRLIVTERGADGGGPPGDVYLLNNESLRLTRLEPCFDDRHRVEDVGFDQTSRTVFISRYFEVGTYSLSGQCVGKYDLSCCTKSPVHLVEGYLADRYLLAAETKGGLWLIDPREPGSKGAIELQREFHGDAAMFAALSPDRRRAAVVFESGRAALVSVEPNAAPVLQDFIKGGTLFGAFYPGGNDRLVTGGEDGTIRHWRIAGKEIREVSSQHPADEAIDWVAFSDDKTQMLAVSDLRTLYVIDARDGRVLTSTRGKQGIDWASARPAAAPAVGIRAESEREPVSVPYPDEKLKVLRTLEGGGHRWIVVEQPGEYVSSYATYMVKGDRAVTYPGLEVNTQMIERQGDLLWFRTEGGAEGARGPLLRVDGEDMVFYPRKGAWVKAVVAHEGKRFLATDFGLYSLAGNDLARLTSATTVVHGIHLLSNQLWIATQQGAYVLDAGSLIRVTEPFLDVRAIKQAGGHVWLLTGGSGGILSSMGPAYIIEHYFARPLPHRKAQVADVVEAAGRTWLLGVPGLYTYNGKRAVQVGSIPEEVTKLVEDHGRLVAKTQISNWPYTNPGPDYEINSNLLQTRKLTLPRRGG